MKPIFRFRLASVGYLASSKRMNVRFAVVSFLGVLLSVFTACTTVPVTGRQTMHLVSSEQLASASASQFGRLKAETPISTDPTYNAMVQRVGERIAYAASNDLPNADWEFVVFDDPQINAFAMPGGKVAVYAGIFKVVRTDADLAVVMGHEIAHVVAGHGAERVTQQILAAGGALAVNFGTKDMDRTERQLLMAAYGAGATLGVLLPYSRLHESEADEIGLIYAARAGYDPIGAIDFWKRMEAEKNGAPPEFLSTHPSDETRQRRLKIAMPRALDEYRSSQRR